MIVKFSDPKAPIKDLRQTSCNICGLMDATVKLRYNGKKMCDDCIDALAEANIESRL